MTIHIPELFTESQAAAKIGISEESLARERKAGRIAYQPIGKRGIRYRATHIADYLDLLEVEATCKKNKSDSSSGNSGSQGGPTRQFGASPGSTRLRGKLVDLRRASAILNGQK